MWREVLSLDVASTLDKAIQPARAAILDGLFSGDWKPDAQNWQDWVDSFVCRRGRALTTAKKVLIGRNYRLIRAAKFNAVTN